jgi:hypothetical protein
MNETPDATDNLWDFTTPTHRGHPDHPLRLADARRVRDADSAAPETARR